MLPLRYFVKKQIKSYFDRKYKLQKMTVEERQERNRQKCQFMGGVFNQGIKQKTSVKKISP